MRYGVATIDTTHGAIEVPVITRTDVARLAAIQTAQAQPQAPRGSNEEATPPPQREVDQVRCRDR